LSKLQAGAEIMRKTLSLAVVVVGAIALNLVLVANVEAKHSQHRMHHFCHWQPIKVRVWNRARHRWVITWAERRVCL
jgi:hypothetical protein